MTNGARMLKRGDHFDPDCWRTSHRLSVGMNILRNLGFTPEFAEHSDKCIRSEKNRARRVFGFNYMCDDPNCPVRRNPPPIWPEDCTDEVFEKAYALACAVQDARGAATARAINSYRRDR